MSFSLRVGQMSGGFTFAISTGNPGQPSYAMALDRDVPTEREKLVEVLDELGAYLGTGPVVADLAKLRSRVEHVAACAEDTHKTAHRRLDEFEHRFNGHVVRLDKRTGETRDGCESLLRLHNARTNEVRSIFAKLVAFESELRDLRAGLAGLGDDGDEGDDADY